MASAEQIQGQNKVIRGDVGRWLSLIGTDGGVIVPKNERMACEAGDYEPDPVKRSEACLHLLLDDDESVLYFLFRRLCPRSQRFRATPSVPAMGTSRGTVLGKRFCPLVSF